MESLKFTSLMAQNSEFIADAAVRYVGDRLDAPVEFVNGIPWQERQELLDAGEIHVAWICGLPYVWRADEPEPRVELLAAPVMRGPRYENRPIYFSDVVVRRDSEFQSFADLRGSFWAYNEPGSHSGYNVVRYHLATLGETSAYFGRVIESGAHQMSLKLIRDGQIDASAIDSTVLEMEFERNPAIRSQLRIIDTLGPSPIPPWVVLRSLPQERRESLREALVGMHEDLRGREILARGPVAQFARVVDSDYDAIREMFRRAESVTL
jgi:phosphonate transport system substrate-binding protein